MNRCTWKRIGSRSGQHLYICTACQRLSGWTPHEPRNVRARCEQAGKQLNEERWHACPYRGDVQRVERSGGGCQRRRIGLFDCRRLLRLVTLRPAADLARKLNDYDGTNCLKCSHLPSRKQSNVYACDPKPLDILHVTPRPNWQNVVNRAGFALRSNGIDLRLGEICKPSTVALRRQIEISRAGVVLVHAFATDAGGLIELARENPRIVFRAFSHSEENHLLIYSQFFVPMRKLLAASSNLANLRVGGSTSARHWQDLGYPIENWHWPCELQSMNGTTKVRPPVLLVSSRTDVVKAIPASLIAAAMIQKTTGCRIAVSLRGGKVNDNLRSLLAATNADAEWWTWCTHEEYLERLRNDVSILIQPSMTETFNYATWEAGSMGRPWVGSYAIAHTPPEWRADPNDPRDIARVAQSILDDYATCSRLARNVARRVGRENNRNYAQAVWRWLTDEAG